MTQLWNSSTPRLGARSSFIVKRTPPGPDNFPSKGPQRSSSCSFPSGRGLPSSGRPSPPFPRSWGGVGATTTRVTSQIGLCESANGFPRSCMRFPSIISRPSAAGLGEPEPGRPSPRIRRQRAHARNVSYNSEHHDRMKHVQRRHFFIRDMVESFELDSRGPFRAYN